MSLPLKLAEAPRGLGGGKPLAPLAVPLILRKLHAAWVGETNGTIGFALECTEAPRRFGGGNQCPHWFPP